MGKRLIFGYEFDASAKTVKLHDIYAKKRFLLITNVTDGAIIYQFNDVNLGMSDISFNYETSETTITLNYDTSSMSDDDDLQILVEEESTDVTVNDRYVDPVSKIRVSNPENLIDTDFEYGLQSTKWETLELTKNIPTFFSRSGDISLPITSMDVRTKSDVVTVVTSVNHGLQRGSPIIIKSSGSVSSDGGFVVAAVINDTTFNFKAKTTFLQSRSVLETFTELFAASIYAGTEFKLTNVGGITTNEASPSELTVSTIYPTDFLPGTSMSLSNSFAKSTIDFDTSNVVVENTSDIDISYTSSTATGEDDFFKLGGVSAIEWTPRELRSTYRNLRLTNFFFEEGTTTVDTLSDYITFTEPHGFQTYTPVVYVCDESTNTRIGGLNNMTVYHVYRVNDFTIRLQQYGTTSSSRRIQLSSNGVSGGVTKSAFLECHFHIYYSSQDYGEMYLTYRNGAFYSDRLTLYYELGYSQSQNPVTYFNHNYYGSFSLVSRPTTPFQMNQWAYTSYNYYIRSYSSGWDRRYYLYYDAFSRVFTNNNYSTDTGMLPTNFNVERSSLWVPNHGIAVGLKQPVQISSILNPATSTTGSLPSPLVSGGTYIAERLNDNRIVLSTTTGSQISFFNAGTDDLRYRVQATIPREDANTITISGNTLNEGDAITYNADSGTVIGGLSDGQTYYAALKVGDRFNLSNSANVYGESGACLAQSSFTWVNLSSNLMLIDGTMPFSTGDAVYYTSLSPVVGLKNGNIYWVRVVNTNYIAFYNSAADATADTNRIDILYYGSGRGTFTKVDIVDITSVPATSEVQKFGADFVGAADGIYSVSSTAADQQSFTFAAGSKIEARNKEVVAQTAFVASFDALYIENHGFITGDTVTYTESGTTNLNGLTSGNDYYIIRSNKDFVKFATTEENAISGVAISLTEAGSSATEVTGTISLQPNTIVGSFNGAGVVDFIGGDNIITGDGTKFTSYFNKGDSIFVNIPSDTLTTRITGVNSTSDVFTAAGHNITTGDMIKFDGDGAPGNINFGNIYFGRSVTADTFSVHYTKTDADANTNLIQLTTIGTNADVIVYDNVGDLHEAEVSYVNSDSRITTSGALPATGQADVNYLQNTTLLLRPDGFALHRPYDGGVELIPPTNPNSQMIRQTRKYFRYQSGKGIQVSFAVNFSPTSQIDSFTRSGDVGTIVTRFPHRLSAGIFVTVSGSTNVSTDTIGTITKNISVAANSISGDDEFYVDGSRSDSYPLYEGRTYRFDQSDSSNATHPLRFSETEDGTHGGGTELTAADTDVFDSYTVVGTPGSSGAYIEFVLADGSPNIYSYCSTHPGLGFAVPTLVDPDNNQANLWNGSHEVLTVPDAFTYTVQLDGTPSQNEAQGVVEYYVNNWQNSSLRCGLYDDQNGIFFEYDGRELFCCRRSSIRQISGYSNLEFKSGKVIGNGTKFASQLSAGDSVVIKGQSHRVVRIDGDELMYIAPSYRGVNAEKVIITKTETTKVPQSSWSLDVCDGTGYTGFNLDIHRIQMAYIDYSWYGAGKVRFGFKDQNGNVRYVHSFVHGNFFTEAYMRSGNVPARYEIENTGDPTYVPALAHWGTSVIMDGRFDPDKAYIFNANSSNITITNASSLTVSGRIEYEKVYYTRSGGANYPLGYAIILQSPDTNLNSVGAGIGITGANLASDTKTALPLTNFGYLYQPYLPGWRSREGDIRGNNVASYKNHLLINKAPTGTSGSYTSYTVGTAADLVQPTKDFPLISVRLAPSVDTSAPGFLGEREIINRMQLILNSVGVLTTHAATIQLVLNAQLSSNEWQRVTNPSLSQVIEHVSTDEVNGGLSVFDFEVQGGTGTSGRTQVLTEQTLGDIATLGNAILGGDNVFPDGPDVLTLVARLSEDPSTVSSSNPFQISGRISWSESQA